MPVTPTDISAQLAAATLVVCELVDATDVQTAFAVLTPLTTQPMGEANGPACGYPNADGRGYLLVIQLQLLARWSSYADSGKSMETLARPAIQTSDGSRLYVRDEERQATVMFFATGNDAGNAEALRQVAAIAYPPWR